MNIVRTPFINPFFKSILLVVCLFMHAYVMYGQTLNADTLVKYHISKILAYSIDNAGEKTLAETIYINKDGKTSESHLHYKSYDDSIHYHMYVNTTTYTYDSNGTILKMTHVTNDSIIDSRFANEKSYTIEYNYKKFFLINPLSRKRIRHMHTSGNKKIIKSYKYGSYTDYIKYFSRNGIEYAVEKHYSILSPTLPSKKSCVRRSKRRIKPNRIFRKCTLIKTYLRNERGDIIEEKTSSTYFYKKLFKKPLRNSYIYTFQYTYKNSFISSCNQFNSSMNNEGIELYEYVTNPE